MNSPGSAVSRVAIVGVGQVGSAVAYALVLASVTSEMLLVEIDVDRRKGHLQDLTDAASVSRSCTRVREATYREAGQSDIVIITAGSRVTLGETRMQIMYRSVSLVRAAINAMKPFRSDTIILVVSNPVDLLTSLSLDLSGLPATQVLGSGTSLDSARLQGLVAEKAGVAASSIDINVVGMHGESEMVAWDNATINGMPLSHSLPADVQIDREALELECKHLSQHITRAKGSTPFGIGCMVLRLCQSIMLDRLDVLPLSHFDEETGCCLSMPAVLGRRGIVRTIQVQLPLDDRVKLLESAEAFRRTYEQVCQNQHVHPHQQPA